MRKQKMKKQTENLRKKLKELNEHSLRVADLARKIAKVFGENEKLAYLAGIYHDVGKLDERIFNIISQERALTADEKKIVSLHSEISAQLFLEKNSEKMNIKDLLEVTKAIKQHHKPKTKLALIIFIADFYDALRHRPNYKNGNGPLSKTKAFEIMQNYNLTFNLPKTIFN